MIPFAVRPACQQRGTMDPASAGVTGASREPEVSATEADRPIRVCFIIDQLRPAGTEIQLLGMINGFDRRRVRPYLCLLDGEDALSRSLEPGDCPILRLDMRKLFHLSSIRKAWTLLRFIRKHRIDVLQAHFPDSTYFGVPAARLAGVPRVVRTRRDLGYWLRPRDRRLGRLYNHLVDATLVNSESVRESVCATSSRGPRRSWSWKTALTWNDSSRSPRWDRYVTSAVHAGWGWSPIFAR